MCASRGPRGEGAPFAVRCGSAGARAWGAALPLPPALSPCARAGLRTHGFSTRGAEAEDAVTDRASPGGAVCCVGEVQLRYLLATRRWWWFVVRGPLGDEAARCRGAAACHHATTATTSDDDTSFFGLSSLSLSLSNVPLSVKAAGRIILQDRTD